MDFSLSDLSDKRHIPSGYNEDVQFKSQHPETIEELQRYIDFSDLDENLRKC